MIDTAILLAAGVGSRLRSAAPLKPLGAVGDRPLIGHAIGGLARAGLKRLGGVSQWEQRRGGCGDWWGQSRLAGRGEQGGRGGDEGRRGAGDHAWDGVGGGSGEGQGFGGEGVGIGQGRGRDTRIHQISRQAEMHRARPARARHAKGTPQLSPNPLRAG